MAAINIRGVPKDLYDLLKKKAEEDQRSINQEIIWLLKQSLLGRTERVEDVWASIDERRTKITEPEKGFSDSVKLLRKDRGR